MVKVLLWLFFIIFLAISTIVWIPDYFRKQIIVARHSLPNGRTLKVVETLTDDFYRRELWDIIGTNQMTVVLDGDGPKAWFGSIVPGLKTNEVQVKFIKTLGTYNLDTRVFTFKYEGHTVPALPKEW